MKVKFGVVDPGHLEFGKMYVFHTNLDGTRTVIQVEDDPRSPHQLPLFTLPPPPTPRQWAIEWRWSPDTVKQWTERSPEWQVFSSYSTVAQARNTIRRLRGRRAEQRNKNFRIRQTSVHHHGDIDCHIPDYPCPVRRALDGSPVSGWAKPTLVPFVMPVTSPFPPNSPSANQTHNQPIPWGTLSAPPEGWQSPTPWLAQPDQWENPVIKPSVGLPPVVASADGSTQTFTFPVVAIPAAGSASWAGSPHLLPPMDVPVDDFVAQFAKAFTADFPEAIEKLKGDIAATFAAPPVAAAPTDASLNTAVSPETLAEIEEGALADDMDW